MTPRAIDDPLWEVMHRQLAQDLLYSGHPAIDYVEISAVHNEEPFDTWRYVRDNTSPSRGVKVEGGSPWYAVEKMDWHWHPATI